MLAPTIASYTARQASFGQSESASILDAATYLVGSPDQVAATLRTYAALGVTHLQLRVCPNGVPLDVAARTVELFGRYVIPAVD